MPLPHALLLLSAVLLVFSPLAPLLLFLSLIPFILSLIATSGFRPRLFNTLLYLTLLFPAVQRSLYPLSFLSVFLASLLIKREAEGVVVKTKGEYSYIDVGDDPLLPRRGIIRVRGDYRGRVRVIFLPWGVRVREGA